MSGVLTVTNLHSGQRWHSQTLERGPLDSVHQVSVHPDCRYQRFEGFGGAFTEAAAYSWEQLPEGRRKVFLDCYFGPEGLGYSRGRVHIGSCDFALGNYACQSGPGDEGFDTSRDDQRLIPMILAAQEAAGKPIGLLLSPWSPPGFMKTNGEMNHGGALKAEHRARWAACMARYAAHYRAAETLAVPGAGEAVSGFAVHWYTGDHFGALEAVRSLWPNQELWFTEGCVEYSRFDGMTALEKAEMYAHDILGNLNGGVNGSLDWNLLLDAKGGPNHVGNFCEAPVMLTEDGRDFSLMDEYWYIGQFSRFIRPGAVRLGASAWTAGVEVTAFENPDGGRVAVLLNRTDRELPVSLTQDGAQGYPALLAAHSIATACWGG